MQGEIIPDLPVIPANLQNMTQEILWKWNQRSSSLSMPNVTAMLLWDIYGDHAMHCKKVLSETIMFVIFYFVFFCSSRKGIGRI